MRFSWLFTVYYQRTTNRSPVCSPIRSLRMSHIQPLLPAQQRPRHGAATLSAGVSTSDSSRGWPCSRSSSPPHALLCKRSPVIPPQQKAAGSLLPQRLFSAVKFVDQTYLAAVVATTLELSKSVWDVMTNSALRSSLFRVVPCPTRIVKSLWFPTGLWQCTHMRYSGDRRGLRYHLRLELFGHPRQGGAE